MVGQCAALKMSYIKCRQLLNMLCSSSLNLSKLRLCLSVSGPVGVLSVLGTVCCNWNYDKA